MLTIRIKIGKMYDCWGDFNMNLKEMMKRKNILLNQGALDRKKKYSINRKTMLAFAFFVMGTSTGFKKTDSVLSSPDTSYSWEDYELKVMNPEEKVFDAFYSVQFDEKNSTPLFIDNMVPTFSKEVYEEVIEEPEEVIEEPVYVPIDNFPILNNEYSLYENIVSNPEIVEEVKNEEQQKIHNYILEHYNLTDAEFYTMADGMIALGGENGYSNYESLEFFFYDLAQISNEEKLNYILENYQLTYEEFQVVSACMLAEAKGDNTCYIDAYAVSNTLYNRIISNSWSNVFSNSLYHQVLGKYQFSVVDDGRYIDYLNVDSGIGYQAILDLFYSQVRMHNYLQFVAHEEVANDKVQFVEKGNRYHNQLKDPAWDRDYVRVLSSKS